MKIETKYSIGDVVYHGRNEVTVKTTACPDCQGTKEWSLTAPNGVTMPAPCPTCDSLYGSTGTIQTYERTPVVDTLTIGSVRFNSAGDPETVSYMCHETGIGSGQIWYESRLRERREDAEADAAASIPRDEQTIADANARRAADRAKKSARRAAAKAKQEGQK